jgi:hypothetical protein
MGLRIVRVESSDGTRLRLDGELLRQALGELEKSCEGHEQPLTLDLREMRSADDESLERLLQLAAGGARLEGASPYLTLRLESIERTLKARVTGRPETRE